MLPTPAAATPSAGASLGAVVLTGGTAVRMDGAPKADLEIGGRTLLEIALAALPSGIEVVVVGEDTPTTRPVTWRREEPPSGGPAAGLLAGLTGFARPPAYVVALAVDMPRVTRGTIDRLVDAAERDGALLVDDRRQYLCAVYSVAALRDAAPDDPHGLPLRRLVGDLDLAEVTALEGEGADIDTWADLRAARDGCAATHLGQD